MFGAIVRSQQINGNLGMAKKLTKAQCEARYEALQEAANHLTCAWADTELEAAEGKIMMEWLEVQACKWLLKSKSAK